MVALAAALAVLGAVFTISTPAVWREIDHAAGRPNLSVLLSQGCVMIWTVMVQILMTLWAYKPSAARRKIRIRLPIAAGTIIVMAVLFFRAPVLPEDSIDFAARYAGVPYITAYLCVYIAAFAWMQSEIVYLCLRTIQVGGRAWLRRGLRVTAGGAVLGLVYCLVRASDVVTATAHLADPARWEDVARLAVAVGVVLPPIGWTMPSWGPWLTEVRVWASNVRAYWRLYPLWSVLHAAFEAKELDPPQGLAARIAFRDLKEWRIPRRLALIWDCMLELRPYRDPELEEVAGRAVAEDGSGRGIGQRAAAEAEILLAALAAYQQNRRQPGPPPADDRSPGASDDAAAGERLFTELTWLVAVAQAIRRRPARVAGLPHTADPSRAG